MGLGDTGEGLPKRIKMRHVRFFIRKTRPYPPCGVSFVTFLVADDKKS